MQNKTSTIPWTIASLAVVLAVVFSVSNIALAKRGSGSDGNRTVSQNVFASTDDDGTPDQGRGDVVVSPTPSSPSNPNLAPAPITVTGFVEIEADVFTDITLVKFEVNSVKSFYETQTRDRALLVNEIAAHFGLDATVVSTVLDYELEDRASRAKDRR